MWALKEYTDNVESLDWNSIHSNYSWIRDMSEVPQDHIHHAEGNVEIHTRMVVSELIGLPEFQELDQQEKSILFAAALMHDVEKRSTTFEENGRIVSPAHAKKGEYTSRSIIFKEHPAPFAVREEVAKLVRHHSFPIWLCEKEDPLRELVKVGMHVNTKHLYILAKADMLGRKCADLDEMLLRVELFKEMCVDENLYGRKHEFQSDLARYKYLTGEDSIDYVPFEDKKFEVVMMAGIPGSGKDYIIKKHYSDLPMVSIDDIRRKHKIDPTDKSQNGRAIQMAKEEVKVFMRKRQSFVFNATNVTRDMRSIMINLFMSYGAKVTIAYVESSYKDILKQNSEREYKVPVNAIDKLISKLEIPSVTEAHDVKYFVK